MTCPPRNSNWTIINIRVSTGANQDEAIIVFLDFFELYQIQTSRTSRRRDAMLVFISFTHESHHRDLRNGSNAHDIFVHLHGILKSRKPWNWAGYSCVQRLVRDLMSWYLNPFYLHRCCHFPTKLKRILLVRFTWNIDLKLLAIVQYEISVVLLVVKTWRMFKTLTVSHTFEA